MTENSSDLLGEDINEVVKMVLVDLFVGRVVIGYGKGGVSDINGPDSELLH